jgi:hypothetical protein
VVPVSGKVQVVVPPFCRIEVGEQVPELAVVEVLSTWKEEGVNKERQVVELLLV